MRTNSQHTVGCADEVLGWYSRIIGLIRAQGGILFFTLLHNTVLAVSVTLAWDPSPDPTVVGYNVFYGVASHTYTNMIDAGNATTVTNSGLVESRTHNFSAPASNLLGTESVFSDELSYTVPVAPAKLQIREAVNGQIALTTTPLVLGRESTEEIKLCHSISAKDVGADHACTQRRRCPARYSGASLRYIIEVSFKTGGWPCRIELSDQQGS